MLCEYVSYLNMEILSATAVVEIFTDMRKWRERGSIMRSEHFYGKIVI
jgi:hypothetical protein